jgi:hypothetical protein
MRSELLRVALRERARALEVRDPRGVAQARLGRGAHLLAERDRGDVEAVLLWLEEPECGRQVVRLTSRGTHRRVHGHPAHRQASEH